MPYIKHEGGTNRVTLAPGERVLWKKKPKKSAFVATKSLTLMPIAIIWLIIDMSFITSAIGGGEGAWFLIPFFALHLMPVWIWLGNLLSAGRQYNNTAYYVTDRRIIIQHGFFAVNEVSVFYKDIRNLQLQIGAIDKLFGVGDVRFYTGEYYYRNRRRVEKPYVFEELDDPQKAYSTIQRIVMDIQSGVEPADDFNGSDSRFGSDHL